MTPFKRVSKEDFIIFLDNYPRPLTRTEYRIIEPEQFHYIDVTLGRWPESVAAFYSIYGGDPNNPHALVPWDYHIREQSVGAGK